MKMLFFIRNMLKIKIANNNEDRISEVIPDFSSEKYSYDYAFSPETMDYKLKVLQSPADPTKL